jgi:hypothetical protein
MDLFTDVGLTSQVHDFNPGIASSGLFWTTALPQSAISVQPGAGSARLHVEHLGLGDYHDIVNSLTRGPFDPAKASFDVRWQGGGSRQVARDPDNAFVYANVQGPASIAWSATNLATGFSFTSSPDGQDTEYAAVGKERNGIFFS